jgi:tetratricopeptide (TPR) repeat protein
MAEAYKLEGNTDQYIKTLSKGFNKYPNHSYFFPRLNDYYISKGMPQKALEMSNKALEADSLSILFLYAKSTLLLNLGRYDESINVSDKIISLNDTLPEPYYNAGMAWMNKVYQLEDEKNNVEYKNKLHNIYRKAMPYIERYRVLSPKDKDNWAPILYKIYFNLNMGKKFDEIDKIITK